MINDLDKCIYSKFIDTNTFVIICLYVDDKLTPSSNTRTIDQTKMMLNFNFNMKDMGEANVTVGIKITKTSDGLILSQEHFIENLLRKFGYYDFKTISTLYDGNTYLKKNIEHCC